MESNPVIWFELYVQDMARATKFYQSVFGFALTRIESTGMELLGFPMEQNKVGAGGALVKSEGVPSGGGGTVIYFKCDDCAVEAKKTAANGGSIHKDKFSIGQYGWIALVVDTEGNMIGLHSMK